MIMFKYPNVPGHRMRHLAELNAFGTQLFLHWNNEDEWVRARIVVI
jgi:hypothetical protein